MAAVRMAWAPGSAPLTMVMVRPYRGSHPPEGKQMGAGGQ